MAYNNPYTYAHMCRDGHQQIGHNDSEHEQCPLCRAIAVADDLRETRPVMPESTLYRARK